MYTILKSLGAAVSIENSSKDDDAYEQIRLTKSSSAISRANCSDRALICVFKAIVPRDDLHLMTLIA